MNMNPISSLPLPPGNLGLPFIGKNKIFQKNYQDSRKEIYQKYGSLYKTRLLGKKFIYFQGYEAVKFVLTNENKYFAPCYLFKNSGRIFGKTSIDWLAGKEHRDRQKLLTKALKNQVLDNYIHTIHNLSQGYFEKWTQSNYVDLYFEINNYTFDLVLKLLLGIDSASESEIDNYLKDMRSGLNIIPLAFPWTKFGRALKSKDKLFNQFE